MRPSWGVVLCVFIGRVAAAGPAVTQAPCSAGPQCLEAGDAARSGKGREPDRVLALHSYEKACEANEARGCLEAAKLYQKGWMFEVERKPEKARELVNTAIRKSVGCGNSDACVVSIDAQVLQLELNNWPEFLKPTATRIWSDAEKLCQSSAEACRWIRDRGFALSDHGYLDRTVISTGRDRAVTNLETQCKRSSNATACFWAGKYAKNDDAAVKFYEPACKAGSAEGCWEYYEIKIDGAKKGERKAAFTEALTVVEPPCNATPTAGCRELGELYLLGLNDDEVVLAKDVAKGQKLIERTCTAGDIRACESLGKMFHDGKLLPKDDKKAEQLLTLGCRLSEADDSCALCDTFPKSTECRRRSVWWTASACDGGDENACASVGDTFRTNPELRDHPRAARYYRRACDAAVKTACASLDEMCNAESSLDPSLCQQSLIHSDLFYEAEWQYRQTGKINMAAGGDPTKTNDKVAGLDAGEAGGGGGGMNFKRGSLDADLVVGIVLDRARQAAIQVVVDELTHVGGGHVAGYLRDLLTQAALMLGDRNTLRREKLTDLARTVVRALIASNLVNTLFPDGEALAGEQLYAQWNGAKWPAKWRTANAERVRRYLTDWTYYLLGETKLFVSATDIMPLCPFSEGQGKPICEWMLTKGKPNREHLASLLHLDVFVEGLELARVIRAEHELDLRRLVEALGRSKTIANFQSTPGLNLSVWEKDLVAGIEDRLRDLREQTDAIAKLSDPATFTTPPQWVDLLSWGRTARKLLSDRGAAALFSREQQVKLSELSRAITSSIPPIGVATAQQTETDEQRATRISADLAGRLTGWDTTLRSDLTARVADLRRRMMLVRPMLSSLGRQIDEIRGAIRRLSRGGLSIDEVPLSGLPELNESLDGALGELKKLDEQLRALFPGARRTQVRFAISAVVRLRGFLSLMDRISRRAPLNQTVGDLMGAVKMLGNIRHGRFSAPLFDVVEPVLDSLETHRPLDADVLFSMIARARLDSLVTSLEADAKRRPCERDESGTECWTVKVIHALQESVQRDGDVIKVDGGVFARRLAVHGDDFRKKHKWSSFFHLTVGFGGMYSNKPPEMDSSGALITGKDRTVPVVAEQIGFGKASPTFWRDTLTLKFGVFGSGILYRMVLDSAESNAVALGGFLALDIHDYIELYVAPAILLYPPEGDRSLTPRLGVSAGISVPLGAYLEKLTD